MSRKVRVLTLRDSVRSHRSTSSADRCGVRPFSSFAPSGLMMWPSAIVR